MKRLTTILAVVAAGGAAASLAAAAAPSQATLTIHHQLRGCHAWAVGNGRFKPAQSLALARGGTITVIDNDVMPHTLIQTSGPAVRFIGKPAMIHMSARVTVVFPKAGVYHFKTKAGEDYFKGIKTIGEDNKLTLTVNVS
jgi:plastocyanin